MAHCFFDFKEPIKDFSNTDDERKNKEEPAKENYRLIDLKNTDRIKLKEKEKVDLKISNGETHNMFLDSIEGDSAKIIIYSEPIEIELKKGEEIEIDLDFNDVISIRLINIIKGVAEFLIKEIILVNNSSAFNQTVILDENETYSDESYSLYFDYVLTDEELEAAGYEPSKFVKKFTNKSINDPSIGIRPGAEYVAFYEIPNDIQTIISYEQNSEYYRFRILYGLGNGRYSSFSYDFAVAAYRFLNLSLLESDQYGDRSLKFLVENGSIEGEVLIIQKKDKILVFEYLFNDYNDIEIINELVDIAVSKI